jgi:DNA-binding NarL/FixJ family response regulator
MANHFRGVKWIRSCREGPRPETGDNSAGYRSPQVEWNRSRRQIRPLSPSSKIIFLSQNNDLDIVRRALGTGALSYVLKAGAPSELLPAVDAVLRGKQFVSSALKSIEFTQTAGEKRIFLARATRSKSASRSASDRASLRPPEVSRQ